MITQLVLKCNLTNLEVIQNGFIIYCFRQAGLTHFFCLVKLIKPLEYENHFDAYMNHNNQL